MDKLEFPLKYYNIQQIYADLSDDEGKISKLEKACGELEIPAEGGDPDTATEMASTGARPATDCTVTAEQVVAIGQFRIGRDRIR